MPTTPFPSSLLYSHNNSAMRSPDQNSMQKHEGFMCCTEYPSNVACCNGFYFQIVWRIYFSCISSVLLWYNMRNISWGDSFYRLLEVREVLFRVLCAGFCYTVRVEQNELYDSSRVLHGYLRVRIQGYISWLRNTRSNNYYMVHFC